MMLPHPHFSGQINAPDIFARLLYSLVVTGLAPESFYVLGPDGKRPRAHYDGVPVDFVAQSIVELGAAHHDGVRTYNMVNSHDDGVSMDTFVDWVESAGYPIDRVADHADWVRRFEAKLQALPEERRAQSSLMVMDNLRVVYSAHPPVLGNEQFVAALKALPRPLDIPHITEELIHKSLADLRLLGLIEEPSLASA
jgi:fatty acid CoA ligase FadD9